MSMGARIKQKREALGLVQQQLADKVGLSRSRIAQLEGGSVQQVLFENFAALADALGVSPLWLMHGKGPEKPLHALPGDILDLVAVVEHLPEHVRANIKRYAEYEAANHTAQALGDTAD